MTKLKTLKDMAQFKEVIVNPIGAKEIQRLVNIIELRQEAIKWIKSPLTNCGSNNEMFDYGTEIKEFIKHFFNITEEELKEQGK
jgi:hypothetical protein